MGRPDRHEAGAGGGAPDASHDLQTGPPRPPLAPASFLTTSQDCGPPRSRTSRPRTCRPCWGRAWRPPPSWPWGPRTCRQTGPGCGPPRAAWWLVAGCVGGEGCKQQNSTRGGGGRGVGRSISRPSPGAGSSARLHRPRPAARCAAQPSAPASRAAGLGGAGGAGAAPSSPAARGSHCHLPPHAGRRPFTTALPADTTDRVRTEVQGIKMRA